MTILYHAKCGGILSANLAGHFDLKTHSISLLPGGIALGTLELSGKRGKGVSTCLTCGKCGEDLPKDESEEHIEADCLVCNRRKPISDLWTDFRFPSTCTNCKDSLMGKKGKTDKNIEQILMYFRLSPSDVNFVSFLDVLRKSLD